MSIPTQSFDVYKGDTFEADGLYRQTDGTPVNLPTSGITIEAYLLTRDQRRLPLTVTLSGTLGHYSLSAETDDWPLGRNQLVIRYTQDGKTRTADPVQVMVNDI